MSAPGRSRALGAARNVLSHNEWRVPKAIHAGPAARAGGDALAVVVSADPVRATAMHVKHLVEGGVTPTDIVVLTRVNALLAPVQAALLSEGIGVDNREGTGFVQRTGVAAALSWLRIATGAGCRPGDVQRAARRPGRGLSPKVVEWMAEQTDQAGLRRLAGRIKPRRQIHRGFAIMFVISLLNLVLNLVLTPTAAWALLPIGALKHQCDERSKQ